MYFLTIHNILLININKKLKLVYVIGGSSVVPKASSKKIIIINLNNKNKFIATYFETKLT